MSPAELYRCGGIVQMALWLAAGLRTLAAELRAMQFTPQAETCEGTAAQLHYLAESLRTVDPSYIEAKQRWVDLRVAGVTFDDPPPSVGPEYGNGHDLPFHPDCPVCDGLDPNCPER